MKRMRLKKTNVIERAYDKRYGKGSFKKDIQKGIKNLKRIA